MKTSSFSAVPRISVAKPASGTGSWSATILRLTGIVMINLAQWRQRARQRRQLSELDDRLLSDIGIRRIDACQESQKHFWQA